MSQDRPTPDNDPTSVFGSGETSSSPSGQAASDPTAPDPQVWGQPPAGGYQAPGQPAGGYDPNAYQAGGYDPNVYPQGAYDPNAYPPGGYDPNAYAQPGYPQQGYAQPGYAYGQYPQQAAYAAPQRSTNTMAILAIVFAFVFPLLGLVFGFVARGQIKQSGEEGDGLALAGIIISAVWLVLIVLIFVFVFVVAGAAVNTIPTYR